MQKFLLLFMVLIFSFAGCVSGQQKPINTKSEPVMSISLEPNTWDFGQVKEGAVLKHDFVIKNASEETLIIQEVRTSCGCTTSGVKKKTLLPGEETLIEVQFNTKGYSGSTQQFVYVHSSSLDNPIIKYIIKAEVVK